MILLHLANAAEQGNITAYIRTVDNDLVVLAVRFFIHSAYQSSGWASVAENLTAIFQFMSFTPIAVRQIRTIFLPQPNKGVAPRSGARSFSNAKAVVVITKAVMTSSR